MKTEIEDELTPETVNELALLHRIRDLKAAFHRAGKYPSYGEAGPIQLTVEPMTDSIRVPMATGAEVIDDAKQYRYIIKAEVRGRPGEAAFGHRTFIDKGTLIRLSRYDIMRYLDDNRKATDHAFAKFLTEGK